MTLKYANNVSCTLASSLADSDTTIVLTPGDGAQLPVIASGTADTFLITITDKSGNKEIISICRRESGADTLYVGTSTSHQTSGDLAGRAQETTTALSVTYTDDHVIELCPTAAPLEKAVNNPPVGAIIAYSPGYFTSAANAGFTFQLVSANTVAAVNTLLNASGWYVCDGAALNDSASGIFNGAGRYLPNLTDDRFLMGDTLSGGIGGENTTAAHTHTGPSHTHTLATHLHSTASHALTEAEMPAHTHAIGTGPSAGTSGIVLTAANHGTHTYETESAGSGNAHSHGNTGASGTLTTAAGGTANTGASAADENRPSHLSCFYIMRVK